MKATERFYKVYDNSRQPISASRVGDDGRGDRQQRYREQFSADVPREGGNGKTARVSAKNGD